MTQHPSPTILLDHGSGGLASQELIRSLFLRHLHNPVLAAMEDSAVLDNRPGRIAFTTDSYVVDPLFFPGGDIGSLAVHGTINDLAMRGAEPLCLSLGLILEEGFPLEDLERIILSISSAARQSGVPIATGDTKVVPCGKADKIFINTSGIGMVPDTRNISLTQAQAGDRIILSGPMADHGITIMTRRAGIALDGNLQSDTMPLHTLVRHLAAHLPAGSLHTLRDPTRGGVATSLCEIAAGSGLAIEISEHSLPVRQEVRAACEILGFDPLYLANEGKCLALVAAEVAGDALQLFHACPEGRDAAIIGTLVPGPAGRVTLATTIGGTRIITPLHGAPLPRIC